MKDFSVTTRSRCEIVDITQQIAALIPPHIAEGTCLVYCPHTTAAITVNENYDPDVKHDILAKLDRLIPHDENFYLVGFSQTVPFRNGRLELGTWQGIYFCEFDGPRQRKVRLYFQKTEE